VTRQFLSKDVARSDGEASAYQYCEGNPIGLVDPTGEATTKTITFEMILTSDGIKSLGLHAKLTWTMNGISTGVSNGSWWARTLVRSPWKFGKSAFGPLIRSTSRQSYYVAGYQQFLNTRATREYAIFSMNMRGDNSGTYDTNGWVSVNMSSRYRVYSYENWGYWVWYW
jgi:hypothetical protein